MTIQHLNLGSKPLVILISLALSGGFVSCSASSDSAARAGADGHGDRATPDGDAPDGSSGEDVNDGTNDGTGGKPNGGRTRPDGSSVTGTPDNGGPSSCTGGASIDESHVDTTWTVGASGSDYTSVQAAIAAALPQVQDAGKTVKLVIRSGVYREEIRLHGNGSSAGTLIIEAEEPGEAVITGADVFSNWTPSAHSGIYEHPWNKDWGYVLNGCRDRFGKGDYTTYPDARKELFFLDGKPLAQQRLPQPPTPHDIDSVASLAPGAFVIDERANKVFLRPPPGVDLNNVLVEGAMRPENEDFGVFKVHNFNNLVLRGLVVTQAANGHHGAMRLGPADNILIEDCDFSRNNAVGLFLNGTRITMRNVTAHENGRKGVGLNGDDIVIEGLAANWNNWKMAAWNYTDCDVAGVKAGNIHNTCVHDVATVGNAATGFWIDVWSSNVEISQLSTFGNRKIGFDWEISTGLEISELRAMYNDVGWLSWDGMQVTMTDSVMANNHSLQVMPGETTRGRDGVSYDSINWTMKRCTVAAPPGNANLLVDWWAHGLAQVGANQDWRRFAQTLTASDNAYFHPRSENVFRHPNGKQIDFQTWREISGETASSSWSQEKAKTRIRAANNVLRAVWETAIDYEFGYYEREPDVVFVD